MEKKKEDFFSMGTHFLYSFKFYYKHFHYAHFFYSHSFVRSCSDIKTRIIDDIEKLIFLFAFL